MDYFLIRAEGKFQEVLETFRVFKEVTDGA
jgi:hypothetical protein